MCLLGWNTKISARESNYGTRIDYFLLTRGLLPWFKHGDILPSLKGSDHCPIYIDLHDEITLDSGKTLTLREAMKMDGEPRQPPRIAAKFWNEFASKQKLLSTFFGQKAVLQRNASESSASSQSGTPPEPNLVNSQVDHGAGLASAISTAVEIIELDEPEVSGSFVQKDNEERSKPPAPMKPIGRLPVPPDPTPSTSKRKKMQADSNYRTQPSKKAKKQPENGSGQSKLLTFFGKPANAAKPTEVIVVDESNDGDSSIGEIIVTQESADGKDILTSDRQMSEDYSLALSLAEESSAISSPSPSASNSKDVWSQLFAPIEPPKCTVHGEPTKEYRVNKPGPNKGKAFFLCSR